MGQQDQKIAPDYRDEQAVVRAALNKGSGEYSSEALTAAAKVIAIAMTHNNRPQFAPILERLKSEIDAAKKREDPSQAMALAHSFLT